METGTAPGTRRIAPDVSAGPAGDATEQLIRERVPR
jgi:hypothetical protein